MFTEKEWRETRQDCLGCKEEMEVTVGSLVYTFDDYTITVENVPMKRCTSCGEEYIPGPIAEQVGDLVFGIKELLAQDRDRQEAQKSQADSISIHYRTRQPNTELAFA